MRVLCPFVLPLADGNHVAVRFQAKLRHAMEAVWLGEDGKEREMTAMISSFIESSKRPSEKLRKRLADLQYGCSLRRQLDDIVARLTNVMVDVRERLLEEEHRVTLTGSGLHCLLKLEAATAQACVEGSQADLATRASSTPRIEIAAGCANGRTSDDLSVSEEEIEALDEADGPSTRSPDEKRVPVDDRRLPKTSPPKRTDSTVGESQHLRPTKHVDATDDESLSNASPAPPKSKSPVSKGAQQKEAAANKRSKNLVEDKDDDDAQSKPKRAKGNRADGPPQKRAQKPSKLK